MSVSISPLTEERFDVFIDLIRALAAYEQLDPPSADAIERLRTDAFAAHPRFEAVLAYHNGTAIGYAIYFETYSSFLAKPSMYLEDLFVLEDHRLQGAGGALFDHVLRLARERGCGRMEWQVLDWNELARSFYQHREAQWMKEWLPYRITL
jgi:GNAT superfamily N-acetyltransferase